MTVSNDAGDYKPLIQPSHLLTVPNVTAHPSTASVPITVSLYDGPFLRGFNVPVTGRNNFKICNYILNFLKACTSSLTILSTTRCTAPAAA